MQPGRWTWNRNSMSVQILLTIFVYLKTERIVTLKRLLSIDRLMQDNLYIKPSFRTVVVAVIRVIEVAA